MVLYPGVLPLLWSERREAVLQLLCGDKGDLAADAGQGGELGKHGPDRGLGLADGVHDGGYGPLEIFQVPVPGGEHLFPVPLVHIDGMEIVGLLIPPDGVHIGVEPLPHGELVAVERHALPLGQGVDHLGVPPGGGNIKSDRPLHTVEVVVEAGGCLHKQGGGYPAQVQRAAQRVLKKTLEQADGLLGVVEVETGSVPLGDVGLVHRLGLLLF